MLLLQNSNSSSYANSTIDLEKCLIEALVWPTKNRTDISRAQDAHVLSVNYDTDPQTVHVEYPTGVKENNIPFSRIIVKARVRNSKPNETNRMDENPRQIANRSYQNIKRLETNTGTQTDSNINDNNQNNIKISEIKARIQNTDEVIDDEKVDCKSCKAFLKKYMSIDANTNPEAKDKLKRKFWKAHHSDKIYGDKEEKQHHEELFKKGTNCFEQVDQLCENEEYGSSRYSDDDNDSDEEDKGDEKYNNSNSSAYDSDSNVDLNTDEKKYNDSNSNSDIITKFQSKSKYDTSAFASYVPKTKEQHEKYIGRIEMEFINSEATYQDKLQLWQSMKKQFASCDISLTDKRKEDFVKEYFPDEFTEFLNASKKLTDKLRVSIVVGFVPTLMLNKLLQWLTDDIKLDWFKIFSKEFMANRKIENIKCIIKNLRKPIDDEIKKLKMQGLYTTKQKIFYESQLHEIKTMDHTYNSFKILPAQRFPRYQLLAKTLIAAEFDKFELKTTDLIDAQNIGNEPAERLNELKEIYQKIKSILTQINVVVGDKVEAVPQKPITSTV